MILLVEDEKNARLLFAKILNNAGYDVVEAGDGLEALALLNEQHCDLVISDILMPNLNGYALAARVRSQWPSMPIVLMSAYVAEETVKAFLNGKVEFISKPIDPRTLITTIQRLMLQAAATQ